MRATEEFSHRNTKSFASRLSAGLVLLLVGVGLLTSGCITPLSAEQESDWRWKQLNPEYRPLTPMHP